MAPSVHFSVGIFKYPVGYTYWPIRMFCPGHSAAALTLHQHVLPKDPQGLTSSRATLTAPQTLDATHGRLARVSLVQSSGNAPDASGKKAEIKKRFKRFPQSSCLRGSSWVLPYRNQAALLVDHSLLPGPHALIGAWMLTEQSLVYKWSEAIRMSPEGGNTPVERGAFPELTVMNYIQRES